MANTTFSGPIRAGNIKDTTGTIVGTNVANIGQVVMSQSIMIDAAVAVGTTTYDVGVIPRNSQLLSVTIRVAIVSNAAGAATVSVGKTGSTQYLIANTNVKVLGETSSKPRVAWTYTKRSIYLLSRDLPDHVVVSRTLER